MRIILQVRKQQQQREQQQAQSHKGEEGEYEENPAACEKSLPPNPSPPPQEDVLDSRKDEASSSEHFPSDALEKNFGVPVEKKPHKASKKRGRKSTSPVTTSLVASGGISAGRKTADVVGKKLPPEHQGVVSSSSSERKASSSAASAPGRKRKHPHQPISAGKLKVGGPPDRLAGVANSGGGKPAAKKKSKHHPHNQHQQPKGHSERKVGACSSAPRRNMGGAEHYGPPRDLGLSERDVPGRPEIEVDPAADEGDAPVDAGPEESGVGAIDVIRYGEDGVAEEVGDDNDDPASVGSGGGSRRPRSLTASTVASSSSSSTTSSMRRRRRPGVFGVGGEVSSSSAGAAASSSAVTSRGPAGSYSSCQTDFEEALKKRGLEMAEQEGDGNCLFRAVSLQVYGDANNHREVRRRCLDFMARDEPHYSQFITDEPFREYIKRKRVDGIHGNNPEIQAISELYNRPVEVFVPDSGAKPINIFHAEYKTADAPIRLSYHDGNHYNAVVDPLLPTAGLGLGLPGLEPGLADRLQLERAKEESQIELDAAEASRIEMSRALEESRASEVARMYDKQKALAMSDMEATDYELERAVLESSMESYRCNEMGRKQGLPRGGASMSSSSSSSSSSAHHHHHHRGRRGHGSSSPPVTSSAAATASVAMMSSAVAAPAPPPAVAAASAVSDASVADRDEYPSTVQELVMNGFDLSKVLRAYDLVGDNFDALLSVLMSNAN
uniref:ubiquitinyl hydrolase 1 n=1 Tax=Odontella aurita TaxID=265563 RepID=A0A7S4MQ37_9STRA|mmetsp:Transcript_28028/g.82413  ORF Transcript_28028/g.82413 Transcript_28028/m.82413 type:complete len:725 (+) Transcript_28028:376-2550(+)